MPHIWSICPLKGYDNLNMLKQIFIKTTHQKILAFFAEYSDKSFHEREIVRQTGLGKGQVNRVLNDLHKKSVLHREQKGRMLFYSLNQESPALKQFKILKTVLDLNPLVETLQPLTKKIILYGSRANGTNITDSDLDLFIVSSKQDEDEIKKIIQDFEKQQKNLIEIRPVIRNTAQWMALEDKDPIYFNELLKRIILWEKPIDESRL